MQAKIGPMSLDASLSDGGPWLMTEADSVPFGPDADAAIPIGTVIPGVILGAGGWSGDRADLRAAARWAAGSWTLEIVRRLDTGSRFDQAFRPNEPVFLWVAAFDHSRTRHSRNMRPIGVILGPVTTS